MHTQCRSLVKRLRVVLLRVPCSGPAEAQAESEELLASQVLEANRLIGQWD